MIATNPGKNPRNNICIAINVQGGDFVPYARGK